MPWISAHRSVSIFWRLRRRLVSFYVSVNNPHNHNFVATELLVRDYATQEFLPIGLDNGAFVVLSGSGTNFVIEDGCLKLIDVSDSQYYPIGFYDGQFVVLLEDEVNYWIGGVGDITLKILDKKDGLMKQIGLFNKAVTIMY